MKLALLLALAPLLGWLSSDLRVDTDTPDALCPDLGLTRQAVAERLGAIEVEGGPGWHARYSIVHAPGGKRGDVVRLVLTDPAGKVQLERDLPVTGECATVAQAIALVLERFFRELGESIRAERPPPGAEEAVPRPESQPARPQLGSPLPPARARPEPSPPAPPASKLEPPKTDAPRRPAFEAAVGAGWQALPAGVTANFGVALFVQPWRLRLAAAWPPTSRSESVGPGQVRLEEWPVRLSLEWVLGRGPWNLSVGPELFVGFDEASADRLDSPRSRHGVAFGPGAALGARYWLTSRFGVGLAFSLDGVVFSGPEFRVSGIRVLDLPNWRGSGALEVMGVITP